jgi:hypothetical protein
MRVTMPLIDDQERTLLKKSGAFAIATVCAIFLISMLQADLLGGLIQQGAFLPIFGTILLVRVVVGTISFFGRERPAETRTVCAFFYRDKWLSDRLRESQRRSVLALGSSLFFLRLAMLGATVVSILCVFLRVMSLGQAVSVFVVGTMLVMGYQAIATSVLLLRQIHMARKATQL